jgi:hypothetical protein
MTSRRLTMSSSRNFPRVTEPFSRALARNVTIAAVVALVVALVRRDLTLLLPVATLAMWFSLGGHYVELAFLNGVRGRLHSDYWTQAIGRLMVWSAGGALLYAGMSATARLLWAEAWFLKPWWFGGLAFPAIELAVHAVLALRRRPNFYDGRG